MTDLWINAAVVEDLRPALEDRENDGVEPFASLATYLLANGHRTRRAGKGQQMLVTLDADGLRALRHEAQYRVRYYDPRDWRDPGYAPDERAYARRMRKAAESVVAACDAALT